MRKTLKLLSALLTYPTAELQAAIPEMRAALDAEGCLAHKSRIRVDRIMDEIADRDLYDLQERYVLLFDRTRSLSLHLFEHVHGESRDRGQAMVDLKQLYERHDLVMATTELPDFIPLYLEFLSALPSTEARALLGEPLHIFEALRQRLRKRKSAYSSVFSALLTLAEASPAAQVIDALLAAPDDDPNDLAAVDAAWEDEEVKFGPGAAPGGDSEGLVAKLRAARRPADGVPKPARGPRTIITHSHTDSA
jgi:nitrate reductase delta subunit